jgi:hypothetical protein
LAGVDPSGRQPGQREQEGQHEEGGGRAGQPAVKLGAMALIDRADAPADAQQRGDAGGAGLVQA